MTTPGGVPNLPQGALTLDNLADTLQDMSSAAMKSRAAERFPNLFDTSTGLNPALDLTPFGILTWLWAGFNSQVANADPVDIQGPQDLPPLLIDFIEGLPLVDQFVELLKRLPSVLSLIPVSGIADSAPNLLWSGNFDDAGSINGEDIWTWISNGVVQPGAIEVVANGTERHLYSNEIPVAPGQQLSISVQTKWDTLTATGSPIVLGVAEFLAGEQTNLATVATVNEPGTSSDWTAISGLYTVPANTDQIRVRLAVLASATAGNVFFDDAQAHKTGLMPANLVAGLSGLFDNFTTLITNIFDGLGGTTGSSNVSLDALLTRLQDFRSLVTDNLDKLTDLLKQIIAMISPTTTIPSNPLDVITTAISIFASWWGITTNVVNQAQTAATQAAANTAAIVAGAAGGVSISDLEFNTVPTTNISSNYTTLYIPGGALGTLNADGLGNAIWEAAGTLARTGFARHTTALSTDDFEIQLVLDGGIPQGCSLYLIARAASDLLTYSGARIRSNSADIGGSPLFTSGQFNPLSQNVDITSGADTWTLRGGYTASARKFKLLQNNSTVLEWTDTTNLQIGPSYRGVGFGMFVDVTGGSQIPMPKILGFTAADRSASAP